ncbi:GH16816 [Drosophila grimshawi]|uniref:GH16816 n=1 Tax=Drosophila grimshawi TaxID=7222 RepID=B4IWV7_DROGR|nr:GH16816 [Drosophila grimshawi]
MAKNSKISLFLWLLLRSTLIASQAKWMHKPTNSVTIRQSALGLCVNHASGSFVEHPTDCRLFYLCQENGDAVLASCPSNMFYNKVNRICDTSENAKCSIGSDIGSGGISKPPLDSDNELNNMVTDAATYCATITPLTGANDRIVYIGSSSKCNHYYICYYGRAILQECSRELHWNAVTAKCDLPERAQCTLEENIGHIARPMDSIFIRICSVGHATLQQCPFYYYFDMITMSCKWSRTARCVRDLNFPRY